MYKLKDNDNGTFDISKDGNVVNTEPLYSRAKALASIRALEAESKSGIELDLSYAKSLSGLFTDKELNDKLAVKFVARDEIRSYVALWGSAKTTDLEREYFTKDTDFWDKNLGTSPRPLTWNHAQDDMKASPIIGQMTDFGDDEVGRWYIATLERSHKYRKAIDALIADGKLGTSSDSAPQYVERVKTGKSTWLKTWPLFAAALTDVPCEPRMIGSVDYLKSLGIELPETGACSWEWDAARLKLLSI